MGHHDFEILPLVLRGVLRDAPLNHAAAGYSGAPHRAQHSGVFEGAHKGTRLQKYRKIYRMIPQKDELHDASELLSRETYVRHCAERAVSATIYILYTHGARRRL